MFDIGLSELLVVFVVGLLILGPERLPVAAKTAGLWIRKVRRSIQSVQREINAQLDQEEMQQKIKETNERILKESQEIQNTITPLPETQLTEPVFAETEKPEPTVNKDATLANSSDANSNQAPAAENSQETPKASNAN